MSWSFAYCDYVFVVPPVQFTSLHISHLTSYISHLCFPEPMKEEISSVQERKLINERTFFFSFYSFANGVEHPGLQNLPLYRDFQESSRCPS